ncbi:MAG: acetoacetate decarboxylase family protein [Anaerolineae bacterium]|nr:acetoacetate decarboxylase family protein [Anaerolineae bacterium]
MKAKRKTSLPGPLVFAGAAALGYVGVRALLGLKPGADEDFFDWTGPTEKGIDVGSARVDLPVMYYRDDSFMGIFAADYEPVRTLLPSQDLYPVTLPDGRATIAIFAFNYLETGIGPYGEIAIALPCTHGQQASALLPLVLESRYPGWGAFVLHLPVTSLVARDAGRVVFGYTKFVADMAFQKRPAYQSVRMSEAGAHILSLTVQQRGLTLKDNRPLVTYSVRDGELLRTTVPSRSVYQVGLTPGSATLELGDHEIGRQLQALNISTTGVLAKNYLTRSGILPAGEPVGQADRPHVGYAGQDREYGQLTVDYDDAAVPVDVYARRGG